jgi:hypothetical protein
MAPVDTEPALDLVKPAGMSRGVMEMNDLMAGTRQVALWYMGYEVIKDNMYLPVSTDAPAASTGQVDFVAS